MIKFATTNKVKGIPINFFKLLETATSESSFIFDYLLYKHVEAGGMDSPLGPILANAFLCHYKKEWLDNCPIHFKPVIGKRYVDDIFVLFSSKEHLKRFVDYVNKQHKCLKFTSEAENDNSVSLLDIKITHHNHNLKHLFIENQISVVYLCTMKVMWIKHIRNH